MIMWNKLKNNKLIQNSSALFSAHAVNVGLGLLATIIIARALPANKYGEYGLFFTLQTVGSMLAELGFFVALSRRIALTESRDEQHKIIGAGVYLFAAIAVFYGGLNYAAADLIDRLFNVHIGYLLKKWWWLIAWLPIHYLLYNMLGGLEKIKRLALFVFSVKATFLLSLIIMLTVSRITVNGAVVAFLAPYAVWGILFIIAARPDMRHPLNEIRMLIKETKEYGFHFFLSYFIGFLSVKLDQFFIAYFFGPAETGYYHLASSLSHPLTLFSKSASTSAFKQMTKEKRFPRDFLKIIMSVSLGGALALLLVVPLILEPVFSARYLPLLSFLPLILFYHFLYAVRYPFGVYFKALAEGKLTLKITLMLIVSAVMFQMLINTRLEIYGPAVAMIAANIFIIAVILYYYRKIKMQTINQKSSEVL